MKFACLLIVAACSACAADVNEIVRRSVAGINADWNAAPAYDFTERDIVTRSGRRTVRTYRVTMIDGTPYNRLIAISGEPLPPAQAAVQERKLHQEISRRRKETPSARRARVAAYEKERRQDHALFREMVKAFDFKLAGEENVDGRRCFVLQASPKPGYRPSSRDTEVLTGMRGKMWVDAGQYQWVKVHAEVFRPVRFGLFIARVKPGTQFTLEQQPLKGNLWLPSHFSMNLNARVLLWSRRSSDDETYSDYRPAAADSRAAR